jgi:hypothetical protein
MYVCSHSSDVALLFRSMLIPLSLTLHSVPHFGRLHSLHSRHPHGCHMPIPPCSLQMAQLNPNGMSNWLSHANCRHHHCQRKSLKLPCHPISFPHEPKPLSTATASTPEGMHRTEMAAQAGSSSRQMAIGNGHTGGQRHMLQTTNYWDRTSSRCCSISSIMAWPLAVPSASAAIPTRGKVVRFDY